MEDLVSVYKDKLDFDSNSKDIRVFIFKNKDDLINKYVDRNLIKMKIDEPNNNQKYDDKFKSYLEELKLLLNPFSKDEVIVVGVFGKNIENIDINNNDVRLYRIEEFSLLIEDVNHFYTD